MSYSQKIAEIIFEIEKIKIKQQAIMKEWQRKFKKQQQLAIVKQQQHDLKTSNNKSKNRKINRNYKK